MSKITRMGPHWRGSRRVNSEIRTCPTSQSSSGASRSSGNSATCFERCPRSSTSIERHHAARWLSLLSPRYSTWRCTTRPPLTRTFSTTLQ